MFESIQLSALLISIFAGVLLGIPSGPAFFFVLDTSLKEGKWAGLKVYGGLFASKLIYIVVALMANNFIAAHQKVESILYLLASFLLLLWGVVIMVKGNQLNDKPLEIHVGSLIKKGFIVGISNPVIPFLYITFLQFIKAYARDVTLAKYLLNLAILEAISFLVLAGVAGMLMKGGRGVLKHWNKVAVAMGFVLFAAGSYQVYNLIEFREGFRIRSEENVLEQQLEEVEEQTGNKAEKE